MSTDVYIDFGHTPEELNVGDDIGHRIGHHAILSLYDMNLLEVLQRLAQGSASVVEPWVPPAAAALCLAYHQDMYQMLANDEGTNGEWIMARGLPAPLPKGQDGGIDDAILPGDLEALLLEHIGQRWRVRVD